jgi:hypothetical protein
VGVGAAEGGASGERDVVWVKVEVKSLQEEGERVSVTSEQQSKKSKVNSKISAEDASKRQKRLKMRRKKERRDRCKCCSTDAARGICTACNSKEVAEGSGQKERKSR